MNCICPECKNEVDLTRYPKVAPGMVIECGMCGIALAVRGVEGNEVYTEIADEGK
jgi:transcription elongation factor Elf1